MSNTLLQKLGLRPASVHIHAARAKHKSPNPLRCRALLLGLLLGPLAIFNAVAADEATAKRPPLWSEQEIAAQRALDAQANPAVEIRRSYALGVNRYALNHATRLIGWQVGESLYFGRAKGEESGIALVWQRRWNQQLSLSNDGIRLTRHF